MKKTYKTKLNISSNKDLKMFKRIAGVYRKMYNVAMYAQEYKVIITPNSHPKDFFLTGTELAKLMTLAPRDEKYSYLKNFDSGLVRAASFAASKAFVSRYKNYLNSVSNASGLTKYMSRKKDTLSFKTTGKVKIFYDYITIPKFGKVKLFEKGYIPQGKKYSNFTFTYDGNFWWMSVDVDDGTLPTQEVNTGAPIFVDFDEKGNLLVNGEQKYENIILSDRYQESLKDYKKLSKKLKRQTTESLHWSKMRHKKVSRTTRNILKTQNKLSKVSNHLCNIKKDYFRKVAHELAKLKPQKVYAQSFQTIRTLKNNFLTRLYRESSTKEFFNTLIRKLEYSGAIIERLLPIKYSVA